MQRDYVIQTCDLRKHFGRVRAVDGIDLSVPRGQVYGFLGPNGAGKTTAIGMILGLIRPTAGRVEVLGQSVSPTNNAALTRVGSLVGTPALVPYLSARQNLRLVAMLHPGVRPGRIEEVLSLVGLEEAESRRAGEFSTGMKQRLGLAMALVHYPELLILDEPTSGMDPAGMRELRTLLRGMAEQGVTVFLSSHLLHEVEQICDRVAVLNRGRVVAEGTIDSIMGGPKVVRVRVPSPGEAAALLQALPGVEKVTANGALVEVAGASSEAVVSRLVANGIVPSEVSTGRVDLEELFLELTETKTEVA